MRDQRSAAGQRGGDGGDQHRLLGVGRAAHAAIAEVPATLDVAADGGGRDFQDRCAALERVVVFIGRGFPFGPRASVFPSSQTTAPSLPLCSPSSRNGFASIAACPGGVRKLDVQLMVVEPPTVRPCRILIALSLVLRAADSWYRAGYACASRILKSDDDFNRAFLDQHHLQSGQRRGFRQ